MSNDQNSLVEIIKERFYFINSQVSPTTTNDSFYFNIDSEIKY